MTKRIFIYSGLLPLLLCFACSQKKKMPRSPEKEMADVSTTNPSLPEKATLSMLDAPTDEGNMLYEGSYSKDEASSPYITVQGRNGKPYILHDDGTNGDKVANDGIYSIIIQQDKVTMQRFLQAENTIPF